MKLRFHVCGLPHTVSTKRAPYTACAFTANILNFCKMMKSLGHTVYHYGAEGSEADCDEHVTCITAAEQAIFWPNPDFTKGVFDVKWKENELYWQLLNGRAAVEVTKRKQNNDFLCIIGGRCSKAVADFTKLKTVEYAVGYYGTFAPYRVFPSYAHMHTVYASQNRADDANGFPNDAMIPHYYDEADFPFVYKPTPPPYLLFVGRMIRRKGLEMVKQIADVAGLPVMMAGQGIVEHKEGWIKTYEGLELVSPNLRYIGFLDQKARAAIMGNALALLAPTEYLEPFGAVAVESQFCGTPAITTDWGAFPETIQQGVTGFRCRVLDDYVEAISRVGDLDRLVIHVKAARRYSLPVIAQQYDRYFHRLSKL